MKIAHKYPKLDSLLGACFNQDWHEDYNAPEEVITAFAKMGGKSHIEQTITELETLLKEEHTFEAWGRILYDDFGCEYYFDYVNDYTPKQFLEKIQKQLEDELGLAEKKEAK